MLNATLEDRAAARLAGFGGFLRANGYGVAGGAAADVLATAQRVGLLDAPLLRWSLRALLCGRADEWRRFDGLFDAWFLPPNRWQQPEPRAADGAAADAGAPGRESKQGAAGDDPDTGHPRHAASRHERLAGTDFRTLTAREHLLDLEALMRRFARRLKRLRLRREASARRGRRLDLPATIRRSIGSGGTPLHLAWKDARRVRPRLVLLIDVSRSMSAYSLFYLRLARALAAELADVHSYIFHTRVTGVSRALHDPDPWRAQEQLELLAQGFGGGTRIGESLAQFEREHAGPLLHRRTALVILSDGYDTGDPAQLGAVLARLARRVRRIVWINPLASRPGYAPVSQGMQAALPHLDLLAPGADLASLRAVLPVVLESLR